MYSTVQVALPQIPRDFGLSDTFITKIIRALLCNPVLLFYGKCMVGAVPYEIYWNFAFPDVIYVPKLILF